MNLATVLQNTCQVHKFLIHNTIHNLSRIPECSQLNSRKLQSDNVINERPYLYFAKKSILILSLRQKIQREWK